METGTVNRWLKKEGEKVSSGDTLAEVETDKAAMPLESFEDGTLLKIIVQAGQTVPVDALVAVIGEPGEDISALLAGSAGLRAGAAAPATPKKPAAPQTVPAVAAPAPAAEQAPRNEAQTPGPQPAPGGHVKASPLARKIAAERGIDLSTVQPSGPGGRIIERDLAKARPGTAAPAFGAPAPVGLPPLSGGDADVPLSNVRQTIARRLTQSKQTIPHWYLYAEVAMEKALQFREDLNAQITDDSKKISINDLIIKVAAVALAQHPNVNAAFNQTTLRRYGSVSIAIAVATEEGLYVPVLKNVERMNLSAISAGVKELARRTRDKQLKADDMVGSGFTISNLGMFGVDHFFAIINPPESAILAVGAIKAKPVVNAAGQIVAGKMMNLSLSCDHRVIDGVVGAKFMATLKELLEHPAKMLL
jgi:pyruvate dehydrogenase E2 component (dihydrolipoamide acetyltransferase)